MAKAFDWTGRARNPRGYESVAPRSPLLPGAWERDPSTVGGPVKRFTKEEIAALEAAMKKADRRRAIAARDWELRGRFVRRGHLL